jgi:multiple sugar transport system permease protein
MTSTPRAPSGTSARVFFGRSATAIAIAAIAIWSSFPIYWMLISSLRRQSDLFSAPTLWSRNLTLDSFRNLLNLTDYRTQFRNSMIVAAAVVVITLTIAIVVAYVLTRFRVRGKSFIVAGILYAYMFPPMLLAIPLYGFFVALGFADSLLGLVISHCTLTLPLAIWLLWGFFKGMPFELEEAARVDGCTRLGSFFRVVLPLSLPGIITAGVFIFLLSWTDYVYALVMITSDEHKTLPLGIASMIGAFDLRWGEAMAGATLIVLPLFAMFAFLSRYFVQGMSAGAVKG